VINPDEHAPKTDEFMLQYEQQLVVGLAARATGIYSLATDQYRLLNTARPYEVFNIPVTNADPGPDGRMGTGDEPGTFITYYDYANEYAGLAFQRPTLYNDPLADRSYKSMAFAVSRRLANNWQFQASYSATKIDEPFPIAYTEAFLDPNAVIFIDRRQEGQQRRAGARRVRARIGRRSVLSEETRDLGVAECLGQAGGFAIGRALHAGAVPQQHSRRVPAVGRDAPQKRRDEHSASGGENIVTHGNQVVRILSGPDKRVRSPHIVTLNRVGERVGKRRCEQRGFRLVQAPGLEREDAQGRNNGGRRHRQSENLFVLRRLHRDLHSPGSPSVRVTRTG
jgi:hypothetical protein